MHQIYPDAALVPILQRIVAADVKIQIFVNDVTPSLATELEDFDLPAFDNSGPIAVAGGAFSFSGVTAHVATAMALPISIENEDAVSHDAYGYVVMDATGTIILACARFDSAPVTKAAGESWIITPVIGSFSAFAS